MKMKKIKILGKTISVPFVALVMSAMIASAALIILLFGTYHVGITSDVPITGETQEYVAIEYDGSLITTALDEQNIGIVDNDPPSLTAGDIFDDVHTWYNGDDVRDYQLILDDTTMPDMTTPESLWYGVSLSYRNDADEDIMKMDLDSMSTKNIKYHYEIDPLFEDPSSALFPFSLNYEVKEMLWRYLTVTENGDGTTNINTVSTSTDDPTRFEDETTVEVEATPNSGDVLFDSWSGDVTSTDNPLSILMDADYSITANFIANLLQSSFGFGGHDNGGWFKVYSYEVYDSSDTLLTSVSMPSSDDYWTYGPTGGTIIYNSDNIECNPINSELAGVGMFVPSVINEFEGNNDAYIEADVELKNDAAVAAGIVFNYQADNDFYLARMYESGSGSPAVAIEHWDGSSWTDMGSSTSITITGVHTLKLVHDSNGTYDMWFDGVEVISNVSCP